MIASADRFPKWFLILVIIVSGTDELFISTNTTSTRILDGGISWTWYVALDTVKLALNTDSVTYKQIYYINGYNDL